MIIKVLKSVGFLLFLLSTPISIFNVYYYNDDVDKWSIINSYGFSIGMILIYIYPYFNFEKSFFKRLDEATWNWILWLTLFTEIIFQIPHSLCTNFLETNKHSIFEWPFRSYGLSDSRWALYDPQPVYVFLINLNDAGLGLCVLFALLVFTFVYQSKSKRANIALLLIILFRDATLFRETIEYMYDHHRLLYKYTTTNVLYRKHAIICLWFVNILWIIAPCLTCLWCYHKLVTNDNHQKMKKK